MALPRLNNDVNYNMIIPSMNKEVRYRPFLMKEEKTLLTAMESKDNRVVFSSLLDTIRSCVKDEVKIHQLTSFDIEYMFLQIRSKSVGETAKVSLECSECKTQNEIDVRLDDIKIHIPEVNKTIKLDDSITLEVDWPSFHDLIGSDVVMGDTPTADQIFVVMQSCFKTIITDDERINLKEVSKRELQEFMESMNSSQFGKVRDFIENIPKLQHTLEFDCVSCGHKNKQVVEGVSNFLG